MKIFFHFEQGMESVHIRVFKYMFVRIGCEVAGWAMVEGKLTNREREGMGENGAGMQSRTMDACEAKLLCDRRRKSRNEWVASQILSVNFVASMATVVIPGTNTEVLLLRRSSSACDIHQCPEKGCSLCP